jgi:hypothetical protein
MSAKIFVHRKYGRSKLAHPWKLDPEVELQIKMERQMEEEQRVYREINKKLRAEKRASEREELRQALEQAKEMQRNIEDMLRTHSWLRIPGEVAASYQKFAEQINDRSDQFKDLSGSLRFAKYAANLLQEWRCGLPMSCVICGTDVTNYEGNTMGGPCEFGVLLPEYDRPDEFRLGGALCVQCCELPEEEKDDKLAASLARCFTGGAASSRSI